MSLVKGAASPEMVKSCHNDQLGVEEGVGSYRRHLHLISGGFRSQLPTKGVIKSSPTTNSLQAIMMKYPNHASEVTMEPYNNLNGYNIG